MVAHRTPSFVNVLACVGPARARAPAGPAAGATPSLPAMRERMAVYTLYLAVAVGWLAGTHALDNGLGLTPPLGYNA